MLLGIQLIIVLSLAVVLAVVFVALLCDFLKGNNEQLQQRNVELRVRQDERDRMGLSQPLAWLQGLAALARQPDMAEAFASSMGLAPEQETASRQGHEPAAGTQREAAAPAAQHPFEGAASGTAATPARPDVSPAAAPESGLPSSMTARQRYDEMKATTRATSWASKEELEQLAGRAARIRARHEASQRDPEVPSTPEAPVPSSTLLPFVTGTPGRSSGVTSIRDYAPAQDPIAEPELAAEPEPFAFAPPAAESRAIEPDSQALFGQETEWEFSIEGEQEPEPAVSLANDPYVSAEDDARREEGPGVEPEISLESSEAPAEPAWEFAETEAPVAEFMEAPVADEAVADEAVADEADEKPSNEDLSSDQAPEADLVQETAPDIWRFAPVTAESPAGSPEPEPGPTELTSEVASESEVDIQAESQSPPAVSEPDAHPMASQVIARGPVETEFWNLAGDGADQALSDKTAEQALFGKTKEEPELEPEAAPVPESSAPESPAPESPTLDAVDQDPVELDITASQNEAPVKDEGSFQDIASEILSGYVETTPPVSRAAESPAGPVAEPESETVADSFLFDLDEELNRAADAAALASRHDAGSTSQASESGEDTPQSTTEWMWSRDDSGSAEFELPPVRRDEMDVAALFASAGANVEDPSTPIAEDPYPAAAEHREYTSPAPAPAPMGRETSSTEDRDSGSEQPSLEVPAGLHTAETLANLIESHSEFRGVAVAVGINDYENLKEKLAASSASDSLTALNRMIVSMLGPQDFAARFTEDEFILLYPGESGSAAQRRLFQVSEKLWDFQLRSLGSLSIMFSWGGLEVSGESFADSVTAARERMYQTRRSRKNTQLELGITRRRVVNG